MARRSDPRITRYTAKGRDKWRVTADAGADPADGRRRQVKRSFATRTDAEAFLRDLDAAAASGTFVARDKQTFQQVADAWIDAKRATVRPKTVYDYESGLKPYLEALGETPIQSIRFEHLEGVMLAEVERGLSHRSVAYAVGLVRQVFDRAVRVGLLTDSPARLLEPAGKRPSKPEAFSVEELRRLAAAAAGHSLEHAFRLTLSGLRRSEVMGLQWADFDGKRLTIRRSRVAVAKVGDSVGATKTLKGSRILPLDDALAALLAAKRREASAIAGWIVTDEYGRAISPEVYSDEWVALCTRAKVRPLDLRAARRSSVTHMREVGVPDHLVAAWHGHDEQVMRSFYSVALDDALAAAGEQLGVIVASS
jgi:integrase